jgi:hypothetical protein
VDVYATDRHRPHDRTVRRLEALPISLFELLHNYPRGYDQKAEPPGAWSEVIRSDLEGALNGLLDAGLHLQEVREQHPREFVSWLDSGAAGIKKTYAYMPKLVAALRARHRGGETAGSYVEAAA